MIREHIFRNLRSFRWENTKSWNWRGMGVSVLFATTIWFFNALNKSYNTQIAYPVQFLHAQDDVVALTPAPEKIILEVTGQGWFLFRIGLGLETSPLVMRIKNPLKTNYMLSRTLLPTLTENLSEIKINHIYNDTIRFDYDYMTTKEFFVKVDPKKIDLSDEYRIVSPILIRPQKVLFTGASRLLAKMPDTLQVKIQEKDISENFRELVDLEYPQHEYLQPNSEKFLVSFEVKEFEEKKLSIPIVMLYFPRDSSVYIKEKFVELKFWRPTTLHHVVNDLAVIADFKDINWADSTLVPFLDRSPNDSLLDIKITPQKFKIYVKHPKSRHHWGNRHR